MQILTKNLLSGSAGAGGLAEDWNPAISSLKIAGVCKNNVSSGNYIQDRTLLIGSDLCSKLGENYLNVYAPNQSTSKLEFVSRIPYINSGVGNCCIVTDNATRRVVVTSIGVFYSTDCGISWSFTNTPNSYTSAFYYSGLLVAAATNGIYTSTDGGATWVQRQATTKSLLCVSYVPNINKWLVGGQEGTLYSSGDGITWTLVSTGLTDISTNYRQIYSIAHNSSIIVLTVNNGVSGGYSTPGVFLTSTDGVVWTMRVLDSTYGYAPQGLAWDQYNNLFVGMNTSYGYYYSANGTTWTYLPGNLLYSADTATYVPIDNKTYFYHNNTSQYYTSTLISTTGTNVYSLYPKIKGIACSSTHVVAVGESNRIARCTIASLGTDTWSEVANISSNSLYPKYTDLVFDSTNNKFIAIKLSSVSTSTAVAHYSSDGVTWTASAYTIPYAERLFYDSERFCVFAVGSNPTSKLVVYRSTDGGITWSLIYTSASATNAFQGISFASSSGAMMLSTSIGLYSSTDGGFAWTNKLLGTSGGGIVYNTDTSRFVFTSDYSSKNVYGPIATSFSNNGIQQYETYNIPESGGFYNNLYNVTEKFYLSYESETLVKSSNLLDSTATKIILRLNYDDQNYVYESRLLYEPTGNNFIMLSGYSGTILFSK